MPTRLRLFALFAVLVLAVAACGGDDDEGDDVDPGNDEVAAEDTSCYEEPFESPEGLIIEDLECGDGEVAESGATVTVHYVGTLEDGTQFDASRDRGQPFEFLLGSGMVIPGWDMGVEGMKIGGTRKLIIPPDLGYGETGAGGAIPPGATLIFEVELMGVGAPPAS